eukprot:scaffold40480_cov67-Phaeocystis_antarctica.AAC.1
MRTVGGPATARRRSELENRRPLLHGQLSSPCCSSGRRFANFQRQRAPAGPPNSGFRADTPRRQHGAQTAQGSRVATVRGALQAALRTHPAYAPPQASSVRHAVSAAMKRRTSSKELKRGAGEMRTWWVSGATRVR